jgi:DNA repair exonuclease SbcCD nuclease subunit
MKILHTADIHLRNVVDERWKALEKLIEIGKREKIDLLVISGDLFDRDVEGEKLRPHIRNLFSIREFKIFIIPGNHDKDSYEKGWDFGEAIILDDPFTPYEFENLRIVGFPFKSLNKEETYKELRKLKGILKDDKENILLYHGELLDSFFHRGDFGEEGVEKYMPVKLSYFKDLNVKYVLAGHFHSKFNVWDLKNRRYFVYSGSPVSITKRELGRRSVNLFEIGDMPQEYPVDTFHYEEIRIKLDPFSSEEPLSIVRKKLGEVHREAKIILNVGGYINSAEIGMTEEQLKRKIKENLGSNVIEESYTFLDIKNILEDELFKEFERKLSERGYDTGRKNELREIAIKAMMEAGI